MSTSITRPVIAFITDFGLGEADIGVMKGVIAGITPDIHIIDITHAVPAQDIALGAWILSHAYRYFPSKTVFVCVVDPGVGSSRKPIALHAGDWYFVGPDNGLFSAILQEQTIHGVVELSNPAYRLPQVSSTFHGRDIFSPAGAYLAGNATEVFPKLGPALDPARLVPLDSLTPVRHGTAIEAHIIQIDVYGNLITSIPLSMVPELFTTQYAQITFPEQGVTVNQRRHFFAEGEDDGQAFLYGDSSGYIGIAVRNGNASQTLGAVYKTPVTFDTLAR
jgi:S-adenosyl-L-methionine hydrolase (adenosine-forming)